MRWRTAMFLGALSAAAGLSGCQTTAPTGHKASASVRQLTAAQIEAAGLSPTDLRVARELHTAKCLKCHKFYDPGQYGNAEWDRWMVKMGKKARLKPDAQEVLTRYLRAFRRAMDEGAPAEVR